MSELTPPLGTAGFSVLKENVENLDIALNTDSESWLDRGKRVNVSWKGILNKNAEALKETQDSITILGQPFTTLAEAQAAANDGKIPVGAVTWVRNAGDASLADEYINNGGTLTATGRKMPSGAAVELISDTVQRLLTALHVAAEGAGSGTGTGTSEAVQNLMTGFHALAETVSNLSSNSSETTHLLAGFDCLVESMTKLVNADQQTKTSVSGLLSSVQICTEMLNTLAAEIVTPDGASQYGYVAFSVPGTVNAGNGS
ncbi:TPA: hypothetical protein RRF02_004994, partial [Klebsiella pneumoniae]|nr:hypothetical protein [Klebsiella pneumoniae]